MQNAKGKMWHANSKIQSTKYLAEILCEKRLGENLWLRHLAQLTFHLHSSCLSCSCTVSLMLDVQASFFATSAENPSNQKRIKRTHNSSCHSCSCTVSLHSCCLDVQAIFFLQPVWKIHQIRKGSRRTHHSSCLSCTTVSSLLLPAKPRLQSQLPCSLMLPVQASFFAASVDNPSNQRKI